MALRSTLRTIGRTFNLFASATLTLYFVISKPGEAEKNATRNRVFSIWSMCFAMLLFSAGTPSCVPLIPAKGIQVALQPGSNAGPDLQAAVDAWNASCPGLFKVEAWDRGNVGSNVIVMDVNIQPQTWNDAGMLEDDDNELAYTRDRDVIALTPAWHELDSTLRRVTLMHELGHVMTNDHGPRGTIMSPWVGYASHELTESDLSLVRAKGFCLK